MSKKPKETPFWRLENNQIIVNPPVIAFWSKFRLVLSVVIAMVAGALAVLVIFQPAWFHLPQARIAYLGAGMLFLAAVAQMLLMVTSVLGATAIVRGDGINIRGRRYPWSRVKLIATERTPFDPAGRPALVLTVIKRGREKKISIIRAGIVEEGELAPLARRIDQLIRQFAAKKTGRQD